MTSPRALITEVFGISVANAQYFIGNMSAENFVVILYGKHASVLRPSRLPFFFHSFPFRDPSVLRSCSSSIVAVLVKRALAYLLFCYIFFFFFVHYRVTSVRVLCVRHRRPCSVTPPPWRRIRVCDIRRHRIWCARPSLVSRPKILIFTYLIHSHLPTYLHI